MGRSKSFHKLSSDDALAYHLLKLTSSAISCYSSNNALEVSHVSCFPLSPLQYGTAQRQCRECLKPTHMLLAL